MKFDIKRPSTRMPKTLVDRVYYEIQNRILYNVWRTGHQALEQELATELGVSRTPVREALVRLQRDGLVKVVPRHGMRVLPISLTDAREINQILISLEALAVELAVSRKPQNKELDILEKSNQKMGVAHNKSDIKAWAQADEDFHCGIFRLSENGILNEVTSSFWGRARRVHLAMLALCKSSEKATEEHAHLVKAIRDGNSACAREILERHHKREINDLITLMEEQQRNIMRFT
jgi:Transcriptional regulators